MKSLRSVLSGLALALFASCFLWLTAEAVHVKSYTKKDGTYVPAHERSSPNRTKNDNYSTKGNVNPYTGKAGTKPGDAGPAPSTTNSIIQTPATAQPQPGPARVAVPLKRGTMADLKSGMTQADLFQVLGTPTTVEGKPNYEVWTYPSGTVFFSPKAGLIAWKENKLTVTTQTPTQPLKPSN